MRLQSRRVNFGGITRIGICTLAVSAMLMAPGFCFPSAAASEEPEIPATILGQRISEPKLLDGDILSCPLQEGESTFIISLPKTSSLDHLTLVNENAEAKGELRIAVSNFRLPANSPKWIEVSGTTAFAHKRRFNLS